MWGQQIYEPKRIEDPKDQTWFFMKMMNNIKFKKAGGFRSVFGIETSYYIKFQVKGEILSFYSNLPKANETPALILFMGSLEKAIQQPDNKMKLIFRNAKILEFQFEGKSDVSKWETAIRFFIDKLQVIPYGIENWSDNEWTTLDFSDLDDETRWKVIHDNEIQYYESLEKNYDYDEFINDKGLADMFNYTPMANLKNRVLLSKGGFKKSEVKMDFDPNFDEDNFLLLDNAKVKDNMVSRRETRLSSLVGGFMDKSDKYMFLVSNIPITCIDEKNFKEDQNEYSEEDMNLHHEIELYCIYVFEYSGKGDYRSSTTVVPMESIEYVHIGESTSSSYRICAGNSTTEYTLTFATVSEATYWLRGIRKCTEIAHRQNKTGMQKFIQTVHKIYSDLNIGNKIEIKKSLDEILMDNCELIEEARLKCLDDSTSVEDSTKMIIQMKAQIREAIFEVDFFLDAFVNHKTFNDQFFKFIVFRFGGMVRYFFAAYWIVLIKRSASLTDFIDFVKMMISYEDMLTKWKLSDTLMEASKADICHLVAKIAFESSKKAVTNLIFSVFAPAKPINGKFQSLFLTQAFSHFNFLANSICKYGDRFSQVRPFLLQVFSQLLIIIFMTIISQLEEYTLDIEQSIALCQSNGMVEFRKFMTSIAGYTQCSPRDLRKALNEEYYDRCVIKLETIGFQNFMDILKGNFEDMLDTYAKGIFTFDVSFFLNDFIQEYEDLLSSMDSEQQENIMFSLLEIFQQKYFLNICNQTNIISYQNIFQMEDKISADAEIVRAFFRVYLGDDLVTTDKLFDELDLLLKVEDYEGTIIILLNLQSIFPKCFTPKVLNQLLKLKIFFSDEVIEKIQSEFEIYFHRKISSMRVEANLALMIGITNPRIAEFIKILKIIYHEKMHFKNLLVIKREKFAFMYQKDAFEIMMKKNSNNGVVKQENEEESKNLYKDQKKIDSMKDVKAILSLEDEVEKHWGNKVLELEVYRLPAISNWGMLESKFRERKRDSKSNERVFFRFDEEVVKTSSDFFGKKNVRFYKYLLMENIRKIGAQGFSFTISQKCYGFFMATSKKERSRNKTDEGDKLVSVILSRKQQFEKNLYEGINLYRLKEIDLSEKLGVFDLEIKINLVKYDYQKNKDEMIQQGKIRVGRGRKESIELELDEDDLF